MERTLALMCGAGVLPARMATEARRQGWRVVAFAFDGAPDMRAHVDLVIPSRITELGAVIAALPRERVTAALLGGRFSMGDVLRADTARADAGSRAVGARAGSRIDARLVEAVISTLGTLGIEVLDQRPFLGELLAGRGCCSRRAPAPAEWEDIRRGLRLARLVAEASVGQTVVLRHGAVTAVEAAEGTTEAIRRGTAIGGPGSVIVKAVSPRHDYRFDTPTIGPETIVAAGAGKAAVVAVEAGRVLILDRDATARAADEAGLALVSVDDAG